MPEAAASFTRKTIPPIRSARTARWTAASGRIRKGTRWTGACPASRPRGGPAPAGECRLTDVQLAEACRRGDRQAQRLLYDRCADRVYRLLLRMTGNPDDAFDLAQDTFIRAFQNIGTFDGASSLSTWIYRIAINEALQMRRRRERGRAASQARRGPSGDLADPDLRLDVAAALERLPEPDRALIVLRYMEGLSYAEMAAILAKPPGTIASGLNRARRALRDILGPFGAGGKKPDPRSIQFDGAATPNDDQPTWNLR